MELKVTKKRFSHICNLETMWAYKLYYKKGYRISSGFYDFWIWCRILWQCDFLRVHFESCGSPCISSLLQIMFYYENSHNIVLDGTYRETITRPKATIAFLTEEYTVHYRMEAFRLRKDQAESFCKNFSLDSSQCKSTIRYFYTFTQSDGRT